MIYKRKNLMGDYDLIIDLNFVLVALGILYLVWTIVA